MRENEFNDLKEQAWRRRLTSTEQAALRDFLAGRADAVGEIERDDALSRLLEQLPNAPVSSNFTARVLASVRDTASPAREEAAVPWIFRSWWVRLAASAAMVCAGFFSFQEFQTG